MASSWPGERRKRQLCLDNHAHLGNNGKTEDPDATTPRDPSNKTLTLTESNL
jgi:hypothetical protein